jgi:WD40 repeat protein
MTSTSFDFGVLSDFSRALARESDHFTRRPDLMWQQLYNRLQWQSGTTRHILEEALAQRSIRGSGVWTRLRTPFSESAALTTSMAVRSEIRACRFSPDGTFIVTGGSNGKLQLWESDTGKERLTIQAHNDGVTDCAIAPAGDFIASAGFDATVKLWDTSTGARRQTLEGHRRWLGGCAIGPNGDFVVSASHDHTIVIWDTMTGREIITLTESAPVTGCKLLPGGRFLVSIPVNDEIRLWDIRTGREVRTLGRSERVSNSNCVVDPGGRFVVYPDEVTGTTLKVVSIENGREIMKLSGHSSSISFCSVSPDARFIVSGDDRTVRTWDVESGRELQALVGHSAPIVTGDFAPDISRVATGDRDGRLVLWTIGDPTGASATGHSGQITDLKTDLGGKVLVTSGSDETLRVRDAQTGNERWEMRGHRGPVTACAVSPDGDLIASAGTDQTVRLWSSATGQEIALFKGHEAPVTSCAFSPDGTRVMSASIDQTIRLWDVRKRGKKARTVIKGHEGPVTTCAFSRDGTLIASASSDSTVRIWDSLKGRQRQRFEIRGWGEVRKCLLTADGNRVIAAGGGAFGAGILIWDLQTGSEHRSEGHSGPVTDCLLSPDDSFIVTIGVDDSLKVWDTATGAERATFDKYSTQRTWKEQSYKAVTVMTPRLCSLTPDGRFVASAGREGVIRLWEISTGIEVATIPLPGGISCLQLYPHEPAAACGDSAGNVYVLEFLGLTSENRIAGPTAPTPSEFSSV